MKQNEISLTEDINSQDSYLRLSIPKERFGEFIGGLLDQPIEISRSSYREFDIDTAWVEQTIYLLKQRITQQNVSEIVSFSGSVGFEKGEVVKFRDLDTFLGYVPSAAKCSISVEFRVSYLVEFPNKIIPEKQSISVGASDRDLKRDKGVRYSYDAGHIWYRIECTERTWGEDIEKILSDQIQAAIVQKGYAEELFERLKGYAGFLIGACAIFVPLALESFRVAQARESIPTPQFDETLDPAQAISMVLEFFQSYLDAGINFYHIMFYVVFGLILILFGVYVAEVGDTKYKFVSLTEKSKKNAAKMRRAQRRKPFDFLRDIAIGVVSSAIVSYIFLKYGSVLI